MNVLSLFDGISCGQVALNRMGIKYDNYYASEIDKHAIQITQHNYPNTIQLGDVTNIKGDDLPNSLFFASYINIILSATLFAFNLFLSHNNFHAFLVNISSAPYK